MKDTEKALQRSELSMRQNEARKQLGQGTVILEPGLQALLIRVELLEKENLELKFRQFELEGRDWTE